MTRDELQRWGESHDPLGQLAAALDAGAMPPLAWTVALQGGDVTVDPAVAAWQRSEHVSGMLYVLWRVCGKELAEGASVAIRRGLALGYTTTGRGYMEPTFPLVEIDATGGPLLLQDPVLVSRAASIIRALYPHGWPFADVVASWNL